MHHCADAVIGVYNSIALLLSQPVQLLLLLFVTIIVYGLIIELSRR